MKTAEEIKSKLSKYIAENEEKIKLWEQVQRVHKKDGTDFANFGKNFTGCKVQEKSYSSEKEIVVSSWTPAAGYRHDEIDIRQIVRYSKITPAPEQVQKVQYLEPFFDVTPDQAEALIADRIETLKQHNAEYKQQLAITDKVYSRFVFQINNALQELKDQAGDRSTLYYEARDYMQRAY